MHCFLASLDGTTGNVAWAIAFTGELLLLSVHVPLALPEWQPFPSCWHLCGVWGPCCTKPVISVLSSCIWGLVLCLTKPRQPSSWLGLVAVESSCHIRGGGQGGFTPTA